MKIVEYAARASTRGPETWFTGMVWVDAILQPTPPARAQSAVVSFAPGARTMWHTHPLGQTLYVLAGLGWAQRQGQPAVAIRPGDVVAIAAGENHWHGAQAGHTMTHLALQEADDTGSTVVWGLAVTEEEYSVAQVAD